MKIKEPEPYVRQAYSNTDTFNSFLKFFIVEDFRTDLRATLDKINEVLGEPWVGLKS